MPVARNSGESIERYMCGNQRSGFPYDLPLGSRHSLILQQLSKELWCCIQNFRIRASFLMIEPPKDVASHQSLDARLELQRAR